METGAIMKTAFCGPCFGAGDTPSNNALSIRHSTRNFPNREGSKIRNGQISSVALMDARSIAATAKNKGFLTSAEDMAEANIKHKYSFDKTIYQNRVYDSKGVAHPEVEIQFGPNIKDWPQIPALQQDIMLKVVSEIHDPVTTTDELIPSGETSSFRSNPLGLAEFTLSRKDPDYVPSAKAVRDFTDTVKAEFVDAANAFNSCPELAEYKGRATKAQIGSTIFAVKPGDGSAREQAASCQRVLGGAANIAIEYATKRYRSNLINWGMIPYLYKGNHEELPFAKGDYIFIPNALDSIKNKAEPVKAYACNPATGKITSFELSTGDMTDDERQIILDGCLINFYKR
jgi:aconitate hydratase